MAAQIPRRFACVELVGDKVRLRPLSRDDAQTAFNLLRDDRVTRTLLWDGPSRIEEIADYYADRAFPPPDSSYSFGIEVVHRPGIVGCIEARQGPYPQQSDIGFWLGVPYWGRGIMTDAIRLATYFAFQHLDVVRVYATVFIGNMGSRQALEKCGFGLDGTLRCHVLKREMWLDEWFFSLLRAEWEARKGWYRPQQDNVQVISD